jgi:hypothetical protein
MSDDKKSVTTFLNVDVDLRCEQGLDELLGYFEPAVLVLHRTTEEASMELNESHRSLEETIVHISELVQSLPAEARKLWERCDLRRLNIGVQAGNVPHQAYFAISSETIARIAPLGFEIVFTLYAPINDGDRGS